MQLLVLVMSAVLVGTVLTPSSYAQNQQQQEKQARRAEKAEQKAQQKAEEEAQLRLELLDEIKPSADRFATAMMTRRYSDPLIQAYLSSLGQSLVPSETPSSITFSFHVVEDIYPNAVALPDGRIFITLGMLAHVENEAQLAMVLGHEIGHVIEEHAVESFRKQRSGQRRDQIVGALAGAALGGLLGGKTDGVTGAVQGVAVGAGIGALAATLIESVIHAKFSREQEEEADAVGIALALERGFEPEQAVRFWEQQDQRFGKRSFSPRVAHSLFGKHPRNSVRAKNVRALLTGDLQAEIEAKRAEVELTTGTPRFGLVISGLMRDTGALIAERTDRHDLAIGLLKRAHSHRPNDPRLLWALGRVSHRVARTAQQLAEAETLLAKAAEQDKRGIYPAIHREIAYSIASHSEDYRMVTEHLQKYVTGYLDAHGKLPSDIDDIYDKMVLFGDNDWTPKVTTKAGCDSAQMMDSMCHPKTWDSPADLATYDAALWASTEQIESAFGGVLAVANAKN